MRCPSRRLVLGSPQSPMPHSIKSENGMLQIRIVGVLSCAELTALSQALHELEVGLGRVPDRIIDLEEVTRSDITFAEMLDLAKMRAAIVFPNDFRSAIVARTPVKFGLARMFQSLMEANRQISVGIFNDLSSALVWLATPDRPATHQESGLAAAGQRQANVSPRP